MQDTWGIPGPTFLAYFIGALAAVTVLAMIHRSILLRGDRSARVDNLGPQQIAWLAGGDKLAVYSSLGGLRAAGAIASGPNRTLVQAGPLPVGVTPLDNAIHHAAGGQVRARDVRNDQWVSTALTQLRDGLEANGLAVSAHKAREVRLWALGAAALAAVGFARLFAGLDAGKPVGFLIPLLFVAVMITLWLVRKPRQSTKAAERGLRNLRKSNRHLSPSESPAYATYGAAGAAMGVALFGAAALYDLDPAFAAEAEIQRVAAGGTGLSDSSSTSYNSCSSSSSSCSGGSSCGGGGGCGG